LKFSTRARYGMRAMLDLALHEKEGLVFLKDIARRQDISKRYLEHMMALLRKRGLVEAERGVGGGYRLARSPSSIRLDEIFETLEGTISPVACLRDLSVCDRASDCVTREVWMEVEKAIKKVLSSKSLADLAKRYQEIGRNGKR